MKIGGIDWDAAHQEAMGHLKALLRFDTTNPPGNETPAARYVEKVLHDAGIAAEVLESEPGRGSCVARIEGKGEGGPLLLTSHLDVVPAEAAKWKHPPFEAVEDGGWLYGRGAIDMKSMTAYALMTMLLLKRHGVTPRRDVILSAVADEEEGGAKGMGFLVDKHPDRVRAEYALNEVGGFSLASGTKRVYPVQVASKGFAWMTLRAERPPAHGSVPREDSSIHVLAEAVERLRTRRLPLHVYPAAEAFVRKLAEGLPGIQSLILRGVLCPAIADLVLKLIPDRDRARALSATLRNTATVTGLRAGGKANVIPGLAEATVDGRYVPGQSVDDLVREVRAVVGDGIAVEVFRSGVPVVTDSDTPLFRAIADVIARRDPGAEAVPYLMVGFTDAVHLAKLGVKTYGFAPVKLPPDVPFASLYHAHDERIPIEGFRWGLETFVEAVAEFVA